MIKGLAHVAYQVSNMDESIAFYEKAFGFKKKFELHDDHDKPWIVYLQVNETSFIELFYSKEKVMHHPNGSYQHLCIEVEGISDVAAELTKKGIILIHPVILGKDHNYQCWVKDPDGNPIELMEYGKNALQLQK